MHKKQNDYSYKQPNENTPLQTKRTKDFIYKKILYMQTKGEQTANKWKLKSRNK